VSEPDPELDQKLTLFFDTVLSTAVNQ